MVLTQLPFKDTVKCRRLSKCWASVAETSSPIELVIPANHRNLSAKVRKLRLNSQPANSTARTSRQYTFQLMESLNIQKCSRLLSSLAAQAKQVSPTCFRAMDIALHRCGGELRPYKTFMQGSMARSCQVRIQLQVNKDTASWPMHVQTEKITQAIQGLTSNHIRVNIELQASQDGHLPSHAVLLMLAPFIQELNFGSASRNCASIQEEFTTDHLKALVLGQQNITYLSLSVARGGAFFSPSLACLGNLQQLHLHLANADAWGQFTTQQGLLEFTLSIRESGPLSSVSCFAMLAHSAHSLQHLSLTACSWDDSTYTAMSCLQLRSLRLEVEALAKRQAQVLTHLKPSQSMHIVLNRAHIVFSSVVQALTSTYAHVTRLELHGCRPALAAAIRTMPNLVSLTLTNMSLADTHLQHQPSLRHFKLRDVMLHHVDMSLLLACYPALRTLKIKHCQGFTLDRVANQSIVMLRHLTRLTLGLIDSMDSSSIHYLEAFVRSQQCIGMFQPQIDVRIQPFSSLPYNKHIDSRKFSAWSAGFDEDRPSYARLFGARVAVCALGKVSSMIAHVRRCLKAELEEWAHVVADDPIPAVLFLAAISLRVHILLLDPHIDKSFMWPDSSEASDLSDYEDPDQSAQQYASTSSS